MIDIERTRRLREQAINLVPETIDQKQRTLKASSDGRYAALFARDTADSLTQSLPHPENHHIPRLLVAAIRTIYKLNQHRGKRSVARTGEKQGRAPHEIWKEDSPQDRLVELQAAGQPVQKNPQTKRLSLVNYFSGDATAKLNQAIGVVAETIGTVYSSHVEDLFLAKMWPQVKAGLQHDICNAEKYGMDVIVTDPHRSCDLATDGFLYQSWRDGLGAYIGDEERKLHPPFVLFPNVCHYIKSLEDSAKIAYRLGYVKEARDLQSKAEIGRERLDRLFWMEDEQYYAPLVDKNGPVKFISCDPADGLFCGVLSSDRAKSVVQRLMEPDMLTRRYGLRTRSSNSPKYTEDGFEAYQNGAVWPNRSTIAALGMIQYGFISEAEAVIEGCENYIEQRGFSELSICTKDTEELVDYRENGVPKALRIQSWFLYGYLGVSAWLLRQANWTNQVSAREVDSLLTPLAI